MGVRKKDLLKNKDDIVGLYNLGISTYKIADNYNTHHETIRQILMASGGVELRNASSAQSHRFANYKKVSSNLLDNINLTKNVIKNWIYDDGTVSPSKGHLRLCTCGFSIEENEMLSLKLTNYLGEIKNIGVVEKKSGNPRIYCSKVDTNNILKKIGKYDIDCFSYKWNNNFKCIREVCHP